ncbi:MAG: 16S rRNA methyltransferase [Candidatus Lokiarchaeota archaeon]|nr:16S rRNA methyltransferase [Candidatus Lokiarchaeota archaeon]
MIWLVLAEAALETVPEALRAHPSVLADVKRKGTPPGKLLLDTNYHHSAMASLPGAEKRGRPDIVHFSLLAAMNTPLNAFFKKLRVCVHVMYPVERIIQVDPATRIPRSINRFEGIMGNLLSGKKQPTTGDDAPLFTIENMTLATFLSRFDPARIHAFSTTGKLRSFDDALPAIGNGCSEGDSDFAVIIGGFQGGHFEGQWMAKVPPENVHSIAPLPLDAWTVVARVVYMVEEAIANAARNPSCALPSNEK